MKHKTVKNMMPLNIQFFAEGDGDGAGTNTGDGDGTITQEPNLPDGETPPITFDDFLKGKENQAEFDRRLQKGITTAITREQEKWKALTDDKLSEAEKLSKMTKEEKEQYLNQKREKELSNREAEITKRELMAEAKNTLTGKELPLELAEILNYASADSCGASIATVEKAFRMAVEKGVEERLKGSKPIIKAPENGTTYTSEQLRSMSPEEINKNWDSISESIKSLK